MILPKKHLSPDRSLIYIGGELLALLSRPKTVTALWRELQKEREQNSEVSTVTFDWFVLALDLLYSIRAIRFEDGFIARHHGA